jgi:hypothetical protein
MTCAAVRERLLASERPDHPGPEESAHLAGCPACHAWLRRLVRLERQLPLVSVPACPPPPVLLARILSDSPARKPRPPLVRAPLPFNDPRRVREGGRQKLALAFSLAATLALFTLAWWAWSPPPMAAHDNRRSTDPYVVKRDQHLRQAPTPRDRVHALANLADEFFAEAREHEDDPKRVAQLAGYLGRLVEEELVQLAVEVPVAERHAVLTEVAGRFHIVDSEASRLAGAWAGRHAASVEPLRQMATSAREAASRLRRLAQAARV